MINFITFEADNETTTCAINIEKITIIEIFNDGTINIFIQGNDETPYIFKCAKEKLIEKLKHVDARVGY
jgi:hypothetical protein